MGIYVRLATRPVPPNRPIATTVPILTTRPISSWNSRNRPIFPTSRPTLLRHPHKWADCNIKRYIAPRQYDEDKITMQIDAYIPICMCGFYNFANITTDLIFRLKYGI